MSPRPPRRRDAIVDAALDLLLGHACAACARPGRVLCARCAVALEVAHTGGAPVALGDPVAPVRAAGVYADPLRALVIAHKERRVLVLARPLGGRLADAVHALLDDVGAHPADAVLLVPVPSRRGAVRARGHDPTASLTHAAARALTATGRPSVVRALLRLRPGVVDQAGLDVAGRAANLRGAMAVAPRALDRARRDPVARHVVVCDDVTTTGATLAEAHRALAAVGVVAVGGAVVAATPRRDLRVR